MNVFDWIFIAALVLGLVLGLIKGFLKPLFSAIGFVVIAFGSSALAPTVQGWLMNVEMGEDFRPLLAIVLSIVGITIVWVLISLVLRKIITKQKGMSVVNRIIGAALGILIVYLVFAVLIAFIVTLGGLTPNISAKLGPEIEASWIRNNIYTDEANFFGNWIIQKMAERIMEIMQGAQPEAESLVRFIQIVRA